LRFPGSENSDPGHPSMWWERIANSDCEAFDFVARATSFRMTALSVADLFVLRWGRCFPTLRAMKLREEWGTLFVRWMRC